MDLLAWMERWDMLPPEGGVLLCAVSGGRDSVCLLHYLASLAAERGFSVAAGHLNHQMRPEAQRDEDFVRTLCRTLEVPFYTEAAPVYEMAGRWGLGVEETGRRLRYDFLARTADAIGAQRIATAHHALDQAETVLLNLLRGTGPEGLGGIPPVRGRIVRPLLQTSPEEIETYLLAHRLTHVEDSTNADTHYARNRLRLEIWPQLKALYPGAERAIGRTAEILRQENTYLDLLAAERLPPSGTAVETAALLAAPEALRPRMVRLLLERLPAGKKDVGASHISAVLALAAGGSGMLELPQRIRAVCRGGQLALTLREDVPAETVLCEGLNRWGSWEITLRRAAGHRVTVRPWRRDDRLETARGSRSIKRLFQDAGIPADRRDGYPVVCVDGVPRAAGGIGEYTPPQKGGTIEITIKQQEKHKEDTGEW